MHTDRWSLGIAMGNCASSHKTFRRAEPEVSPVLAKIRAAQQKYFDDNIEGREDATDSDSTSDTDDEETERQRTLSGESEHTENIIQKASDSTDGRIRFERRGRFFSMLERVDRKARDIDPRDYDFPFRNIVLEGGGNKGIAYCGAVRVSDVCLSWVGTLPVRLSG